MPTDNQDRQDQPQPIENRLRKALHEHAQQVSPSSEAFFTINQRISRREAASAWSPRVLWEKRERLRLQPSLVLSLVLLVALSVVTTLLLTRDTDATQTVQVAAPSSTESPTTPEQPDNNGTEPTPTPTTVATTPGHDDPYTNNPNPGGDEPVKVVTDESEPPDTPTPSSTTVAPPTTTNPPTPTTAAPPDTTTTTAPPETDPPPPERPSETLFEVRPLQVARNGYPVVYAEHRLDSERLSTIPVVPEDGPYKTTLNTAVDNDGTLWVEVLDPEGNAGWVLSHTVSVQPHLLTSEETTMFGGLAQVLVNFVGAVDEARRDGQPSPETMAQLTEIAHNLRLSSRGAYVALADQNGSVYGYNRYNRDTLEDYLLGNTDGNNFDSILQGLRDVLSCLSEAPSIVETSSVTPPAALQRLNYTALTDGDDCNLLVYFDFLQQGPEIIAFSIHS